MSPRASLLAVAVLAACSRPGADENPAGRLERMLTPDPIPVRREALDSAAGLVRRQVAGGAFPAAVLAIGNRELIQRTTAFGRLTWDSGSPPATADSTLFDLASLTKVVTTTAAVMALVDDGRMRLDDPVRRWLPEFSTGGKERITVRHLLTHTGGLRAGAFDIRDDVPRERVLRYLLERPLVMDPGEGVLYSDLGFVVLAAAAERAAGEPLEQYVRRRVWAPLGMRSTRMGVPAGCPRCAPTLHLEQGGPYAGGSYDEVGRRLDGVAGNAGTFSTGADLARFAAAIANGGRLGDIRVFSRRTVRRFTLPQRGTGTRGLGFEAYCREGIVPDVRACNEILAVGHTGASGVSIWIDPWTGTWVVLLTNRTYLPKTDLDMQRFRRRLFRVVAAAGS